MKRDSRGNLYVEYDGRRMTFVPKGRHGDSSKDWSNSHVVRIQTHRYENGHELNTLCPGAELHFDSFEDVGNIIGLLARLVTAGFLEAKCGKQQESVK